IPVALFVLMIVDNEFSRFDGIILLMLMLAYILFLIQDSKEHLEDETLTLDTPLRWITTIPLALLGIVMVLVGAHFAVDSASSIAKNFGISQWVIGIVLISFGTSLPELVVSIVAAIKNKADMAIGNIIGSNMANIAVVLGVSAIAKPMQIETTQYTFDIVTLVVVSLLLVFMVAGKNYTKPFGLGLLLVLLLFLSNIAGQI
ncbi:MAG TPA: sodium:calcium antiporter, partial [Epsilonproteobacteria bacterium]|nr:sodium:calcium antiporter [Campylobacterota bacterium]